MADHVASASVLAPRATQEVFVEPPPTSGIAIPTPVDPGMEQLPSDAEVVPLGLPQPAELPERSAWERPRPSGLEFLIRHAVMNKRMLRDVDRQCMRL